jgi:hypothetical protein
MMRFAAKKEAGLSITKGRLLFSITGVPLLPTAWEEEREAEGASYTPVSAFK